MTEIMIGRTDRNDLDLVSELRDRNNVNLFLYHENILDFHRLR